MNMIYFILLFFVGVMGVATVYMCVLYDKSCKVLQREQRRDRLRRAAEFNRMAVEVVKWVDE